MSGLSASQSLAEPLLLYRMSVEQYHAMIETGILMSGDPIELLEGLLVQKGSKSPAHCFAVQKLYELFTHLLSADWFVNNQEPITTSDSEPEPDVAVIRGERRYFLEQNRHPGPEETALIIEVAESSLARDRGPKRRIYARAGIPQYWIVNFVDRRIEVYTNPTGPCDNPTYHQQHNFGPEAEVPLTLDGHAIGRIRVADLLP